MPDIFGNYGEILSLRLTSIRSLFEFGDFRYNSQIWRKSLNSGLSSRAFAKTGQSHLPTSENELKSEIASRFQFPNQPELTTEVQETSGNASLQTPIHLRHRQQSRPNLDHLKVIADHQVPITMPRGQKAALHASRPIIS